MGSAAGRVRTFSAVPLLGVCYDGPAGVMSRVRACTRWIRPFWVRARRTWAAGLEAPCSPAAAPPPRAAWHIVWLLPGCWGFTGFWTWEVQRHEHLCDSLPPPPPPPQPSPLENAWIPFTSSPPEKKRAAWRREESIRGTSPGLSSLGSEVGGLPQRG